jgi:pimeloyl-ACP methyl ester carboxylesterase
VPVLALFGRPLGDEERRRFARLPDGRVEEWSGSGHMLHLADPGPLRPPLRGFAEQCALAD